MDVSRRQFLLGTTAAVVVRLPLELQLPDRSRHTERSLPDCAVLDLGEHCGLRESLSGFEAALTASSFCWTRSDAQSLSRCTVLIVPAAMRIRTRVLQSITRRVESGATVILESGAAFADEAHDLSAHRHALQELLGIEVGSPLALWPKSDSSRGLPYVDYTWPIAARVRDFSRAIPLGEPDHGADGDIVARLGGIPVALRRRIGAGLLIFLGSPLGPALWAGDVDGRRWLDAVISGPHGLPRPR